MIGISIHSDCIRAVRLTTTSKKQYKLKQCYSQPLYEGDIVQGKIMNLDSFKNALKELKIQMEIKNNEEVFVGIPNAIAKLDSIVVDNKVSGLNTIIDNINIIGNKNDYNISVPFISSSYKVEIPNNNPEYDKNGNLIKKNKLIKTISFCAVPKTIINDFSNAFLSENYNIVSIEPNSIAIIRYLRHKTNQPALIIDVEYDYSTFIVYSEKYGLFAMNSNNTGLDKLINYNTDENGEILDSSKNHQALVRFWNAAKLAEKYYKEINMKIDNTELFDQNDKNVKQIIFMNNESSFIAEELDEYTFETAEILSAQNMIPTFLAKKIDKKAFVTDMYNYYVPMVIALNSKNIVPDLDNANRDIEVNFVPKECLENAMYNSLKTKTNIILISALAISTIYGATTIGMNIKNVYSNTDAEKVTPELKEKYDDAKNQEQTMKDNIVKYNTVASNKNVASPIIDSIISAKPDDVYLTNMHLDYKNKRVILECITENKMSSDIFLQQIKNNPDLISAQILSLQTKNNKTAFQVNVPIGNNETVSKSVNNKSVPNTSNNKTNNNTKTNNNKIDDVLNGK